MREATLKASSNHHQIHPSWAHTHELAHTSHPSNHHQIHLSGHPQATSNHHQIHLSAHPQGPQIQKTIIFGGLLGDYPKKNQHFGAPSIFPTLGSYGSRSIKYPSKSPMSRPSRRPNTHLTIDSPPYLHHPQSDWLSATSPGPARPLLRSGIHPTSKNHHQYREYGVNFAKF